MQRIYELHSFSNVSENTNDFHTSSDYSHVTSIVHMERNMKMGWTHHSSSVFSLGCGASPPASSESLCEKGSFEILKWICYHAELMR